MRKYKIVHFPVENEWSIMKEKDGDVYRLSLNGKERIRVRQKERAKRFFHKEQVISALVIVKSQGDQKNIKTEEEYIDEKISERKIKETRGEL